ncbi:hypothetical protein AMECASPLE_016808 [Ameca splendens]|uniref:Uncharacterized protein n=1 Tax=Ameca splendens TaxID=208324 RepID=A0ABV0YQ28_9TELE
MRGGMGGLRCSRLGDPCTADTGAGGQGCSSFTIFSQGSRKETLGGRLSGESEMPQILSCRSSDKTISGSLSYFQPLYSCWVRRQLIVFNVGSKDSSKKKTQQ